MNFKKLIKNSMLMFIMLALFSCGGKTHNKETPDNTAEKTEVPAVLTKNQDVKEYFETLEKVIDEYATMIEKIAETGKNAEKKDGETSLTDAMNMLTDVTSSTMKMAPLLEKMEKLEKDADILKEEMTTEEIDAFSKTYIKIMARFYEMGKKAEKI